MDEGTSRSLLGYKCGLEALLQPKTRKATLCHVGHFSSLKVIALHIGKTGGTKCSNLTGPLAPHLFLGVC